MEGRGGGKKVRQRPGLAGGEEEVGHGVRSSLSLGVWRRRRRTKGGEGIDQALGASLTGWMCASVFEWRRRGNEGR